MDPLQDRIHAAGRGLRRRALPRAPTLRRIYEIEPLRCRCGGDLLIVSVLPDPVAVDRILLHRETRGAEGLPNDSALVALPRGLVCVA